MRSAAKYIWLFIVVAFVGGFLLFETSGLLGSAPLTPTTAVAEVNGRDILYTEWQQRVQQTTGQQRTRALSQDELRQIENETLEEMITQVLLEQEYKKRHIRVSDEELREFARYAPPPFLYNAPDLQTDGRFDPAKYQRLLASPQARQGGLLIGLETYYRQEIPKEKLYGEISSTVYISEADLWRYWQDERDSAQVSYVAWRRDVGPAAANAVTDAEARTWFDQHKSEYSLPGHAWMSVVHIPRIVSPADTAAARARLLRLRAEIAGGVKFEDVAKRESEDSVSGALGGDLGRGARGRFDAEFEAAAFKLKPKELSAPVATPFGLHLIRVDERKGDTLSLRHILVRIAQSDSAATATDQQADELARIAVGSETPSQLDSAAVKLNLIVSRLEAVEGQPAAMGSTPVPSASAWAFGGATVGEISELFDDEGGYWMARLDSIVEGGEPNFERARQAVRQAVAREKSLDAAMAPAQRFAAAASTGGFEATAKAQNQTVIKSPVFTRLEFVPGIGQFNTAIGAAFGLTVGAVSEPVRSDDAVFVLKIERRVNANREQFDKQAEVMRRQRLQQLQQQRLQLFHADLRKAAKVVDYRKEINAKARRAEIP
ncbi:MAG: peptidyl-prolyl cis-trans isomerase [Gemmatimonadota bacterium]